jgi:pimeloyl-ACP methyl ester carboxylesterase
LAYETGLRALLAVKGWEPVFYCCGYDWRRSNRLAAQRLRERVSLAMAFSGGEKVVLIAHSMGGLVARYFMRALGGEAMVRGCALVGSPTLGAPEAYAMVKSGVGFFQVPQAVIMHALGRHHPVATRQFFRKLASAYELLPVDIYPDPTWLLFDQSQTGFALNASVVPPPRTGMQFVDCRNTAALYRDAVTGFMDNPDDRSIVLSMLTSRRLFNAALASAAGQTTYAHPNTFVVSASNHKTVVGGEIDALEKNHFEQRSNNDIAFGNTFLVVSKFVVVVVGRLIRPRMTKETAGDETVPDVSGKPSALRLTSKPQYFDKATKKHGDLCTDEAAINKVRDWIFSLLP